MVAEEASHSEMLAGDDGAQGWHAFSVKGQENTALAFVGHMTSMTRTQLRKYNEEAVTGDSHTAVPGCVPINFPHGADGSSDGTCGPSFANARSRRSVMSLKMA